MNEVVADAARHGPPVQYYQAMLALLPLLLLAASYQAKAYGTDSAPGRTAAWIYVTVLVVLGIGAGLICIVKPTEFWHTFATTTAAGPLTSLVLAETERRFPSTDRDGWRRDAVVAGIYIGLFGWMMWVSSTTWTLSR